MGSRRLETLETCIAATQTDLGEAGHSVRVISSPAGPAEGYLALELDATALQQDRVLVHAADTLSSRRASFGERLPSHVFSGRRRRGVVRKSGTSRCRTSGGTPLASADRSNRACSHYPELLQDPRHKACLGIKAHGVMSRYVPVPQPSWIAMYDALRILVDCPPGLPSVDRSRNRSIEQALRQPQAVLPSYSWSHVCRPIKNRLFWS